MSYIDGHLMEGEKVIYITKLHWIIFRVSIIFFILALLAAGIFAYGLNNNDQHFKYIGEILGGIFLLIALVSLIQSAVPYVSSEFGCTNKRVMIKRGFIKRESLEILLTKVEAMHVRQGIAGRIFNYGTIEIRGTGGSVDSFDRIRAPLDFRMKVLEQVSMVQK